MFISFSFGFSSFTSSSNFGMEATYKVKFAQVIVLMKSGGHLKYFIALPIVLCGRLSTRSRPLDLSLVLGSLLPRSLRQ